ncbi:MAG: hypothetical protein WD431_01950 [Cyclobacteriaceae bacterium]
MKTEEANPQGVGGFWCRGRHQSHDAPALDPNAILQNRFDHDRFGGTVFLVYRNQLPDQFTGGQSSSQLTPYQPTEEEEEMADLTAVVLADTEDVRKQRIVGKISIQSYPFPTLPTPYWIWLIVIDIIYGKKIFILNYFGKLLLVKVRT